jgi:hypothetical protein
MSRDREKTIPPVIPQSVPKALLKVTLELLGFKTFKSSMNFVLNKTRRLTHESAAYMFHGKKLIGVNGDADVDSKHPEAVAIAKTISKDDKGISEEHKLAWFSVQSYKIVYKYDMVELNTKNIKEILGVLEQVYTTHFEKFHYNYFAKFRKVMFPVLFVSCVIGGLFIKVPEKAMAPVSVVSYEKHPQRAKIRGVISSVVADGAIVKKGELIATIDSKDIDFDIRESLQKNQELIIKIEIARKKALLDQDAVAEMELLKIEKLREENSLEKLQFYKKNSNIIASISGTVHYEFDHDINGMAVKQGDDVLFIKDTSKKKLLAHLNEKDYGVLSDLKDTHYFFYDSPEVIHGTEIMKIEQEAKLTVDNNYAFNVDLTLDDQSPALGTRGYVQFNSTEVTLFYYFFRKGLIYFRGY